MTERAAVTPHNIVLNEDEKKFRQELFFYGEGWVRGAPQLFIDVDVEADGKAGHGSLLSIGAVSPYGEQFYIELQPTSNDWVEGQRQFCEEHGLKRERLLEEGVDPIDATFQFVSWAHNLEHLYNRPLVFTAFNAGFDFSFIDLYCLKAGLTNPFGIAPFDLKSKAMDLNEDWDWAQTAKGKLPKIIVPDGEFTHNALEDAIYQQKIHFGMAALQIEGMQVQ